jgi:hypothetical protein
MKYLKLFESDKLYLSISHGEWEEAVGYYDDSSVMYVPFTDRETSIINNIIGDRSIKPVYSFSADLSTKLWYDDIDISITKLDDEWYYIADYERFEFYKCDTFDGLKDCLSKIID